MSELKPCPFCGGHACAESVFVEGHTPIEEETEWVSCTSCAAQTNFYIDSDAAIYAWNGRAYEQENADLKIERDAQQKLLDAALIDANRYRWLRDNETIKYGIAIIIAEFDEDEFPIVVMDSKETDLAVDDAMTQQAISQINGEVV